MKQHPAQEIINAFTEGDHEGFRQVFNWYYPALYYFSEKLIWNNEVAEEITADTFRKLFKRCIHFNTGPDIRAFLYITARNSCLDYLRSSRSINNTQVEFSQKMKNEVSLQLEYGIKYELIEMVRAAVNDLPEECQKVFRMIYYEQLTPTEVSESLHIPVSRVNAQKLRAYRALGIPLQD